MPPPGVMVPPLNNFTCPKNGTCPFTPGDYDYDTGQFENSSSLTTSGTTTRLYFNTLNLTNSFINTSGPGENLFIYVSGNLNVAGKNQVNAIIYVDGNVNYSGQATLEGALAAGGNLNVSGRADVTYDADAVANADLSGLCGDGQPAFDLQFGTTSGRSVTFDRAFESGVTPLVFLMPTIDVSSPSSDGPASLFLTSVSNTGFSFTQEQSPSSVTTANSMTDVSWIAVTPGSYTLSDGTPLVAGTLTTNAVTSEYQSNYDSVSLDSGLNVALHQLQTDNNSSCWSTSIGLLNSGSLSLALDLSDAWNGAGYCIPGAVLPANVNDEEIAYLATSAGNGTITVDGTDIQYDFANFNTGSGPTLSDQCNARSSLTGFTGLPSLVGKKTSRNGLDGGWLRRCYLSASSVSMVVDEDEYWDSERNHNQENYSIVALEVKQDPPVLQCVNDDFSAGLSSDSWDVTVPAGVTSPYVTGGRLRITEDATNQAAALTLRKLFPADANYVVVEFDYYGWSPNFGGGADGMAVIFSDGSVTPEPGSFGGSLGYAQRNNGDAGFAGGWLGVGFDEWGNFANPTEGRVGGPGSRPQAVSIRGSEASNYNYLTGTAANLSPNLDLRGTSTPGPGHRYRITLDSRITGSTEVLVERDINNGSGYFNLIPGFDAQAASGQGAVPADFFLSFTGSTGDVSNNHEIDNLQVCAIKMNDLDSQVHHFEFEYSATPLTCTPEVMTLKACADASCSQLVTDSVSAVLSVDDANAARWQTSTVNLTNGSAQVSLQGLNTSPVTIGISSSTPAADNPVLCSRNGAVATAAQCSFSFADSGFLIDVPDKLAGQPVTANITAVRSSDNALVCTPAFASVSKDIEFWSGYNSPSAPVPVGSEPQIALFGNDIGRTQASSTTITTTFDAQGQAQLTLDYPDAGRVSLNASYSGAVGDDDEGLTLTGSGSFVSAPVGLCVSTESTCSAADATCPVFKRAGETFKLNVSGRAWVAADDGDLCNNPVTPNYAHTGIQLGSQLVAPVGGANGVTGLTSYDHTISGTGQQELEQSVSEVGVFRFSATPPADYLGSSSAVADIPAAVSEPVGRFVPAEFLLSAVSLIPACGSGGAAFSYMGQEFSVSFTATARNLQQAQTQNFVTSASSAANFANATALLAAENANSGVDMAARLSSVPTLSWINGVATVTGHAVSFNRPTAPGVDGPFVSLDTGIIIQDGDGVAEMVNPDMDAGSSGVCSGASCTSVKLGSQQLLFGRLTMDNVYGPETEVLQMPLRAEYWNGSNWAVNLMDSCTAEGSGISGFNPALLSSVDDSNGYSYDPDLAGGQAITRSGSGPLVQGQSNLLWQSTGSSLYRGWIQAPLASPSWLKFYWNWDGSSPTLAQDPRSSAYFGTFRGHDKKLHWREQ
ncbi:MSHA biogenesis protein MshQ [Shewanella submarina]|uniref:DUF6701 domain-containing protein n=1 Tax=Shewanella submarina TaxID=2016376 RepID=A0ABV7GF28_9GAMM|nr:DUF6701 domain-containing protein [Shewanella submarina]MCL1035621.1 MSHA biogenesis protein MshQ [Shewanella submarina]